MTSDGLIAPNKQAEVQRTIDEHPEIDTMDETARGEIIDITASRINHGYQKPWGRKARNNDPNNPALNTDGMTYLRPDGRFEIYDCISGIDGQSTWDPYGPFEQGENGYWWPVEGTDEGGGGEPVPPSGNYVTQEQLALVQSQVDSQALQLASQAEQIGALQSAVDGLKSEVAQPLHAHGPVNLPLVFQDLTHLRAKGDIDVDVKVGTATPPATDPDEGVSRDELVKFLLIRRRREDGTEEPDPESPSGVRG